MMNKILSEFINWAKDCGEDAFYIFENEEEAIKLFLAQRKKEHEIESEYYNVLFYYNITSSNLEVIDKIKVSVKNPYLSRLISIINSIKLKNDIFLSEIDDLKISDDDKIYLHMIVYGDYCKSRSAKNFVPDENEDFISELECCLKGDEQTHWLAFQKVVIEPFSE